MKNIELSKRAMYDDLFFAPYAIVIGVMGCLNEHKVIGVFLILFGSFWLSCRIYHLLNQDEVFGSNK